MEQQTAVEWFIKELDKYKEAPWRYVNKGGKEAIIEQAKQMEKEQSNDKIQKAIEKFEEAKNKSSSLKDIVYLDGVLAVLDTIKNETFKK